MSYSYIIGFVISGAIAYWVYTDALKRGMNAVLWAIMVFFFCVIALPLYFIMRKPVGTPPAA